MSIVEEDLIIGRASAHAPGKWGIWSLIATEGALFGYLLFSYFYLYLQSNESWPPGGPPELFIASVNTGFLLASSVFVWLCEKLIGKNLRGRAALSMAAAVGLGTVFVGLQLFEWSRKPFGITSHLYGSLYFTITGFHMAHVLVGLVMLATLLLQIRLGHFGSLRHGGLQVIGLYWHFVDVVWLFVFFSLYLSPYLAGGLS